MSLRWIASVLIVCCFACIEQAHADFFQYTDSNGTVVIVDDASKIPARYRKQMKETKSTRENVSSTGVIIKKNRVYVPVTLTYNGTSVEARMLLDTGASSTMITTNVADRLGIRPDQAERRLAQVADGRILETYQTQIDSLSVGPKSLSGVDVNIMPMKGQSIDADGLLGMNFLGEFRYHLDKNMQTINWMQ